MGPGSVRLGAVVVLFLRLQEAAFTDGHGETNFLHAGRELAITPSLGLGADCGCQNFSVQMKFMGSCVNFGSPVCCAAFKPVGSNPCLEGYLKSSVAASVADLITLLMGECETGGNMPPYQTEEELLLRSSDGSESEDSHDIIFSETREYPTQIEQRPPSVSSGRYEPEDSDLPEDTSDATGIAGTPEAAVQIEQGPLSGSSDRSKSDYSGGVNQNGSSSRDSEPPVERFTPYLPTQSPTEVDPPFPVLDTPLDSVCMLKACKELYDACRRAPGCFQMLLNSLRVSPASDEQMHALMECAAPRGCFGHIIFADSLGVAASLPCDGQSYPLTSQDGRILSCQEGTCGDGYRCSAYSHTSGSNGSQITKRVCCGPEPKISTTGRFPTILGVVNVPLNVDMSALFTTSDARMQLVYEVDGLPHDSGLRMDQGKLCGSPSLQDQRAFGEGGLLRITVVDTFYGKMKRRSIGIVVAVKKLSGDTNIPEIDMGDVYSDSIDQDEYVLDKEQSGHATSTPLPTQTISGVRTKGPTPVIRVDTSAHSRTPTPHPSLLRAHTPLEMHHPKKSLPRRIRHYENARAQSDTRPTPSWAIAGLGDDRTTPAQQSGIDDILHSKSSHRHIQDAKNYLTTSSVENNVVPTSRPTPSWSISSSSFTQYLPPVPALSNPNLSASRHWKDDGVITTDSYSALSCAELGWRVVGFLGSRFSCGESRVDNGRCPPRRKLPHFEASEMCTRVGARLCSVDELHHNIAAGSGCELDNEIVWTHTRCTDDFFAPNGGFVATTGAWTGKSPKCAPPETGLFLVRCCADSDPPESKRLPGSDQQIEVIEGKSSQSCVELGWDALEFGSPKVCGASRFAGKCPEPLAFIEAREFCLSQGARLCTTEELLSDEARGSGCRMDTARTWAAIGENQNCNKGRAISSAGSSMSAEQFPSTCVEETQKLKPRCCADVLPSVSRRSCAELGWRVQPGSGNVCAGSHVSERGGCSLPVPLQEARRLCVRRGARLCTAQELSNDEARGSGCGNDAKFVWTRSPCIMTGKGRPGYLVGIGSRTNGPESVEQQCRLPSSLAGVRCCADVLPTTQTSGLVIRSKLQGQIYAPNPRRHCSV